MKNVKKLIVLATAIGVLGLSGAAYAADLKTPADIAAALTGKSITDVTAERAAGKTYGTIANDAGKLEEFKIQVLAQKKASLEQSVQDGTLTQLQADQILTKITNNQAVCDGTGNAGIGREYSAGFGQGKGSNSGGGYGTGNYDGSGFGGGKGTGKGMNQ